jgi:Uma2 family endonuclease
VVRGRPREVIYQSIPSRPALIVEIAESSLTFDRRDKGSLYARAGVADYWIVNLVARVLEVYREPAPADDAPSGWRYHEVTSLQSDAVVTPLAAPHARVAVANLLP